MVKQALEKDPAVKFMMQKMEEAGCGVGPEFFRVEHCEAQVGGGFRVPDGVVVCHNHLSSGEEVRHALLHELVHAYDHCRAADLDWSRCEHHACSEVRAAALSGDCNWKMELFRGNLGLAAQHRACARRRALISVSMNPACQGGRAQRAVAAAFERCFADTAPFERIP
ncbi:M76 peptidase [Helicosporidium sp. ATCC 50920]|nr:M76 peptidase [Helicosporidium sp. ATCC 50920]|eukprot:KDD75718.1 M76 peptidase [Helicosporidium sp. ATCC 50920]